VKGCDVGQEAYLSDPSADIVANMSASSVTQYLAALPADRRAALSTVRKVINANVPDGYEEGMQFGMIGWYVPLSVYPAGYGENPKVPLPLVGLASQKSGMVLHFLCFYGHPTLSAWFISEYKKSGKKLDMGKGCVRFKKLEYLALDVVGRTIARVPVEEHIANYRAARALFGKSRNASKGAVGPSNSDRVCGRGSSGEKAETMSAGKRAKSKKRVQAT
jgi:uncharacterized protein YdhG (YjbR/CyaY superfamily)